MINMLVLKILDNKGFYSLNGEDFTTISKISNQDVYNLFTKVILFNEVEFNENVDDLRNPAEIIIYTNILEKVKEIHGSKEEVIESIEEEYEKLKSKYELSDI